MKKTVFANPLLLRVVMLFLSAFGGWLVAEYPSEVSAFCGVSHDIPR